MKMVKLKAKAHIALFRADTNKLVHDESSVGLPFTAYLNPRVGGHPTACSGKHT